MSADTGPCPTAPCTPLRDQHPSGSQRPRQNRALVPLAAKGGLAVPRSEPAPDEIGKHAYCEPVIEQSCSGAALLPCCGKQFERATLARVELTSFVQSTHRISLRRDPASKRRMIRVSCIVQGRTVILRSLGKRPASIAPTHDFFVKFVDKPTDNYVPLVLCHRD